MLLGYVVGDLPLIDLSDANTNMALAQSSGNAKLIPFEMRYSATVSVRIGVRTYLHKSSVSTNSKSQRHSQPQIPPLQSNPFSITTHQGATRFTRIPSFQDVRLKLLNTPLTPNFEQLYCTDPGKSIYPARLDFRSKQRSRSLSRGCRRK